MTDTKRGVGLAAGLKPIMPETYDRQEGQAMPHARAFGSGLVDPMGIPSWMLDAYAQRFPNYSPVSPASTDWYRRRMQEARDESPIAAGIGSSAVPMLMGGGVARGLGELTTREAFGMIPYGLQIGGGMGGLRGAVFPPTGPRRPQASYPPGGAY